MFKALAHNGGHFHSLSLINPNQVSNIKCYKKKSKNINTLSVW